MPLILSGLIWYAQAIDFPNSRANKDKIRNGFSELRKVARRTKAEGTINAHATPIKKFFEFLDDFNIPIHKVTSQPRSYRDWD